MMGPLESHEGQKTSTHVPERMSGKARPVPVCAEVPALLAASEWMPALGDLIRAFSGWLDAHEESDGLWPAFGVFVRERLLDIVGARRTQIFRVDETGRGLRPLVESLGTAARPITGLAEHVLATGRRYIRGDWTHGPLVDALAAECKTPGPEPVGDGSAVGGGAVAWMFAIHGREAASPTTGGPGPALGLVVVGDLPETGPVDRAGLDVLANLIGEFWRHVRDFERLRLAQRTDRGSSVLNREDFLAAAEIVTAEAMRDGEPVVAMAVAMEGLRRLDDNGQWAVRDRLVREAGRVLRRKLRSDDLVGRFSDDRFVAVLRRLDAALGRLIATKVVESIRDATSGILTEAYGEAETAAVMGAHLKVRCGLAAGRRVDGGAAGRRFRSEPTDGNTVSLNDLLAGALSASAAARRAGREVCVAPETAPASVEARE